MFSFCFLRSQVKEVSVQMKYNVAFYIIISNAVLLLCVADYVTTYPDFFTQMSALANSSLFTVVRVNAIVANLLLVWTILTPVFFGTLAIEELSSIQQNVYVYAVEFAAGLLYGEQHVFHAPSIVLVGACVMGYLWSHICDARLQILNSAQSSLGRLLRVARLAIFVMVACESLTVLLTSLWNAQSDPHSASHTFYATVFLHLTLLLLSFLEFTVRLVSQECSRILPASGISGIEMVYIRRLFKLVESILFIALVARTVWNGSQAPILLLRRVIVHLSALFQTPSDLYKFYKVSRRLRSSPPVTQEELDAEEVVCTICYETITRPDGTRRLHCSHAFHESCLRQWLEEHSTCPYCRTDLLAPPNTPPPPLPGAAPEAAGAAPEGAEHIAGEGEVEGEIEMAYLEYLNSASLLQQVHLHSSPASPIFNFSPRDDTSSIFSSEVASMGDHVGTLRHLPVDGTRENIAATIQKEEEQEIVEFRRAASAIAAAEQQSAIESSRAQTAMDAVAPPVTSMRGPRADEKIDLEAAAKRKYEEAIRVAKEELDRALSDIHAQRLDST